eukprot:GHUV01038506.1.p2 GENE.GHUV01038506.1~~GHUV01038506.1.p2  ORF type:complete len:111 (+),score=14.17 GHUV01038506.1:301-633(+)
MCSGPWLEDVYAGSCHAGCNMRPLTADALLLTIQVPDLLLHTEPPCKLHAIEPLQRNGLPCTAVSGLGGPCHWFGVQAGALLLTAVRISERLQPTEADRTCCARVSSSAI